MVEFSIMLEEVYGHMIRINIVKDDNSFLHLAQSLVHLVCLPTQHLVQNKISSQIPATLGYGSQRMIFDLVTP